MKHAQLADAATSAVNATHAANADTLAGRAPTSFAAADRFRFGTADDSASASQTLFSAGPLTVKTDGDSDTDSTIRIESSSPDNWAIRSEAGGIYLASSTVSYSTSGGVGTLVVLDEADPAKAMFLTCGNDAAPNLVDCWAALSPAF